MSLRPRAGLADPPAAIDRQSVAGMGAALLDWRGLARAVAIAGTAVSGEVLEPPNAPARAGAS